MTCRVTGGLYFLIAALLAGGAEGPRAQAQAAGDKPVRLRGYVVNVVSPTELTVDDYRIVEDRTYRVTFDGAFQPNANEPIAVGSEVEIEGVIGGASDEVRATVVRRRVPPSDNTPPTTIISTVVPIEPEERTFWKSLLIEVKEPNFDRRRSGEVSIVRQTFYQVIANADVQNYVSDLGWRLVPPYQRDLPDGDPAKVPFKFYVVKLDVAGAVALANGVVMVFSRTFEILQNDAQLAGIMSHEIAHVTQKHLWQLSKMTRSSAQFGYDRAFENQADRLALAYTVDAGYDPREAVRSWKLFSKKLGFSPLRLTHENYAVRRAYMMGELEQRYRDFDYSALKANEADFKRIAGLVKKP